MAQKSERIPDAKWLATVADWLEDTQELLIAFTPAGCGGSTGYVFCSRLEQVEELVGRLSEAARIIVYRRHALGLRGTVDAEFIRLAMENIPMGRDFLLISMQTKKALLGFSGYRGRNHDELEEYLHDCIGEQVSLGIDPDDESAPDDISVVYKGGVVGAY